MAAGQKGGAPGPQQTASVRLLSFRNGTLFQRLLPHISGALVALGDSVLPTLLKSRLKFKKEEEKKKYCIFAPREIVPLVPRHSQPKISKIKLLQLSHSSTGWPAQKSWIPSQPLKVVAFSCGF